MSAPRRLVYGGALFMTLIFCAEAETDSVPLKVNICELYKNPERYAGKLVEFRATVSGYRDPSLERPAFSRQEPCSAYMTIALEFPENVQPKPAYDLERDQALQKFEDAVQKPMRIEATVEGRFDLAFVWKDQKRIRIGDGKGYGKKHTADARLVLRRMSDVEVRYMPRR